VEFLRSLPDGQTGVAVEGSEQGYNVPGAATATTTYDEHDRPSEVQLHDASHVLIHTIVMTRDREGRVLTEEGRFLGPVPFGPSFEEKLKIASDDHDNVVEEATESRQTDMSLDDDGNAVEKERPVPTSRNRLDYQYDAKGNWTEKVVSAWIEADGDFRRWSLERRVISYWPN
jgi:hypothetical protein